ncbi:MAG: glutamate--tRNA ligase [Armatimonadetes bacterium]|nr:glutamate--tRNA ligase [Armatimonadota bacterium]MBX3109808.1 glutamate--tRNA ligase [Fimbriimonadaceae bacterium]
MPVRVRFAPSPTGLLHIGALRTVVFNDFFAKGNQGILILRIEDTDRSRYNPESEQEFIDTLAWAGIEFDEGPHAGGPHAPYRQSERKEAGIYAEHIQTLLENGAAYKAFDTPEDLEQMREFQRINKMPTGYFGGEWRDATPQKVEGAESSGKPFVIRLKVPHGTKIKGVDAIRGNLEWDGGTVDDPVLIKADGMPTYHFAAMVDDHLMGITHVFRGEEWISSYPKHIALYGAFGWEMPVFVHCPVIVGADGKKLSKRHGATRVLDYAAQGFLPQPLRNFIALIGWSPGDDREAMTDAELAEAFDIKGIQPSPGRFDMEKLRWMNGLAIRAMDPEALFRAVSDYVGDSMVWNYWNNLEPEEGQPQPSDFIPGLESLKTMIQTNPAYVKQVLPLEQERVGTLADFGPACHFFFIDEVEFDAKAVEKAFRSDHVEPLFRHLHERAGEDDLPAQWEHSIKAWAEAQGIERMGPIIMPIRVAMTGKLAGPGLFDLLAALGRDRVRARLERALAQL